MPNTLVDKFQRFLLPGLVFQSLIIGGGYATGREIVEFFLVNGPWGGLLGMAVSTVVWSLVLAASFELVRVSSAYDYRSFFKILLGRGWFLFEISYLLLVMLVLSVISAASGTIIGQAFSIDPIVGSLGLAVLIGVLVFYGSKIIEAVLSVWSFVLYGVFVVLLIACFSAFGDRISEAFSAPSATGSWFRSGLTYAGYNVAAVPAVFFCLRHLKGRKDAVTAGLLAGPIAIVPGVFLFIAMLAYYPDIGGQTVPLNFMLEQLEMPVFLIVFQIVIFGTFIETGTAMIHAVNERIAEAYARRDRTMPRLARPILAIAMLATAILAGSKFGIIALIAKGYGLLTYSFILLLVVPVLTIGIWKIRKYRAEVSEL